MREMHDAEPVLYLRVYSDDPQQVWRWAESMEHEICCMDASQGRGENAGGVSSC